MVEKLLRQHGMEVTVAGTSVRALFQPVTGKLERLALPQPGPLGLESQKRYIYIGPVEPELREDMVLAVAGKRYSVRTAQVIPGNHGPAYTWGLCVEKGSEDEWGMSSSTM